MLTFWSIVVSVFGILMSVSWFVQSAKIFRNKSAKDISLAHISLFAIGTLVWLIYGIKSMDMPVILSFSIGFIGVSSVLLLTIKYT